MNKKKKPQPQQHLEDRGRLDWVDENWDSRLLDVRGHLNNEDCCKDVREAIDHMARIQAATRDLLKR